MSKHQDNCLPPQVLQINNQDCPTLFHRVTIPAEIGDDKAYPPKPGLYRNTLLVYDANKHVYMFSSDGIPTLISDGSRGIDDYNELTNKPSIEGHELVDDSSLEDIGVMDAIEEALEDYTPTSDLAEVAFSGDYEDLENTPTIPTVNNATLTVQKEGSSIGTFTANSDTDTTVNVVETDPTVPSWAKQPTKPTYSYSEITDKPTIPAAQVNSDWNANSGVAEILNKPTIPTVNDATLTITQNGTSAGTFTANASSDTTISLTDTTYSDFSGATSSVAGASGLVPAPAAGDQGKVLKGDGTWGDKSEKFVIMKYGESNAWAKFIAAYNENAIVYCRASSNANPATGSQTRLAFMAYVNNAENPTEVEFQYVRSVSTKTTSQPVDQVFVYKLTNASGGTWTVQTRDMAPKLTQGTNTTVSYSNGTYTISATQPTVPTKTSDLMNDGSDGTSTYVEADQLAAVATSGSYNDLLNRPTVPEIKRRVDATTVTDISPIYVAGDGTTTLPMALKTHGDAHTGSFSYININEPTNNITEVYAGGYVWDEYEDWWRKMSEVRLALYSDIPTVPTVNNATLTVTQNGTTAGTFTANASSNVTIALTDTTYSAFSGATSSAAGGAGLVPAPAAGDNTKFLAGDGTWQTVAAGSIDKITNAEIDAIMGVV